MKNQMEHDMEFINGAYNYHEYGPRFYPHSSLTWGYRAPISGYEGSDGG